MNKIRYLILDICDEWLVLKLGHVIFLKFDVILPRSENALSFFCLFSKFHRNLFQLLNL